MRNASRFAVITTFVAGMAVSYHTAVAQNIGVPGYGNLTFFGTANVGPIVHSGVLGATEEGSDDTEFQDVKSSVGLDWLWDVGRSYKLIGHYEYGGNFGLLEDIIDDARPYRYWGGFSNFLGAFTYGRQPLTFKNFYGNFIDRSQQFYATGYTTPQAGGLELSSDVLKFSTSISRFELAADYQPGWSSSDSGVDKRIAVGARYLQWLSRISFGVAYDQEERLDGETIDRTGVAVDYHSEQWSLSAGAHVVSDDSSDDTIAYNLLGTFQITPDNELHLSLSTIDDDDVYDDFVGAGYYLDHKIGSQLRIYSEGAVTETSAPGAISDAVNYQVLLGVRYDFGNVYY